MRKMIYIILAVTIIALIAAIIILAVRYDVKKVEAEGWEEDYKSMCAEHLKVSRMACAARASENEIRLAAEIKEEEYLEEIDRLYYRIAALTAEREKASKLPDTGKITDGAALHRPPEGCSNWYPCEPYLTITDKTSEQWALQLECETDPYTSIRRYIAHGRGYDCAAIGNMAECQIGDAWEITLRSGLKRYIICGDWTTPAPENAPPMSTEAEGRYPADCGTGVLEFIVDYAVTKTDVKIAGTLGALYEFGDQTSAGDIIEWQYLGRVWSR